MVLTLWKSVQENQNEGFFPKKLHLWVDMTHKGGPNPDHIGLASDPRYGKVNPQV